MNGNTPYELTITQKLQQLPLPNLADAIWARVERQLDIDLPTNDGGDLPSPPSGNRWMGGAASGLFVGAFVLVFLLFKNEKTTGPAQPTVQKATTKALPVNDTLDSHRMHKTNTTIFRGPSNNAAPPPDVPATRTSNSDSVVSTRTSAQPDTQHLTTDLLNRQYAVPDSAPPKKGRGVTGITDNDYRIVPAKKDSL